ncbi:hypothetical protein QBC47DRAFT_361420 [Echria macrotheca]|uniref:Uncharacterized protein n=1 Tax=Echria macrotheca TaxID=438768 RepID=A0AAJ0F5A8_9PEZI|nr:hypothetical protein QBC47DRAFT_361420 [Echria macrotheca]
MPGIMEAEGHASPATQRPSEDSRCSDRSRSMPGPMGPRQIYKPNTSTVPVSIAGDVEEYSLVEAVDKMGGAESSSQYVGAVITEQIYGSTAEKLGQPILGKFVAASIVGVKPLMGIGPWKAIPKIFELTGLTKDDVDIYEIKGFTTFAMLNYIVLELGVSGYDDDPSLRPILLCVRFLAPVVVEHGPEAQAPPAAGVPVQQPDNIPPAN